MARRPAKAGRYTRLIELNKKKAVLDVVLNIIAVTLPTLVLQLIAFPLVASTGSDEVYGLLTAEYSLMSLLPGTLGTSLNNVRLLYDIKYGERGGDFQLLCLASCSLTVVGTVIALAYMGVGNAFGMLLICLAGIGWCVREYLLVAFRIKIDYKLILVNNALQALGYLLGCGLFFLGADYALVLLVGQLLPIVHLLHCTSLWREPCRHTAMLGRMACESAMYALSVFLGRAVSYSDRILLFPIVGARLVGVYYASSLVGKVLSMLVTPLTTVMLTYLAKARGKSDRQFTMILGLGTGMVVVGMLAIAVLARPVLAFLYPSYVDDAMQFVYIISLSGLVNTLASMLNPFVVRFYPMKWQVVINGIVLVVYLVVSFGLLGPFGLMGFCAGVLAANFLKLALTVVIYYRTASLEG